MPNWVTNMVSFKGDENEIQKMMEWFQNDEEGFGSIDFNKIIPMPETLMVTAGGNQTDAISVYLSAINPNTEDMGVEKFKKTMFNKVVRTMEKKDRFGHSTTYEKTLTFEEVKKKCNNFASRNVVHAESEFCKEDLFLFGKTCCTNLLEYGAKDWYSWRCDNWGTKWNANCNGGSLGFIDFQTAWAMPLGIFEKLSQLYPNIEITCKYADEDRGNNCGILICKNGKTKWTDKCGDYKFAMEILGEDLDEYYFTKDGVPFDYNDFPIEKPKEIIDSWTENLGFTLHGMKKRIKVEDDMYDFNDLTRDDMKKFLKRMEKLELDISDFFYS